MEEPLEINVRELRSLLTAGSNLILIDVREPNEFDVCHINGSRLIPMGQIPVNLTELNPNTEYVFYCHTGARSATVVDYLRLKGFRKVRNLKGGIDQWAVEIDPSMTRY